MDEQRNLQAIDVEQWKNLVTGTNELGRVLAEEFGVALVFHPHVDTHVDTGIHLGF